MHTIQNIFVNILSENKFTLKNLESFFLEQPKFPYSIMPTPHNRKYQFTLW